MVCISLLKGKQIISSWTSPKCQKNDTPAVSGTSYQLKVNRLCIKWRMPS